MGRMCCVVNCRAMYKRKKREKEKEKVTVYGFPSDPEAQKRWVDALPNLNKVVPTKYIGVCKNHWPQNFVSIRVKGASRPRYPPSIFDVPSSCMRQSVSTKDRQLKGRRIDYESRQSVDTASKANNIIDKISDWSGFVKKCKEMPLTMILKEDKLLLLEFNTDKIPPEIDFSMEITHNFKLKAFKGSHEITTRDVIKGFSAKLQTYNELSLVINKLREVEVESIYEVEGFANKFKSTIESADLDDAVRKRFVFLCEQIELTTKDPCGRRYKPDTMKEAINLYLRSRNCYNALRETLALPGRKTISSYFGKLGDPAAIEECKSVITQVFSTLTELEKICFIQVDEIHIKPSIRYQGGHILGYSVDDTSKAAKTVLAMMITPMMGKPSFVARLLPIFSISHELLHNELVSLLGIINDCGGYPFGIMSDNLRANQSCFNLFHKAFKTKEVFSVDHPFPNKYFDELFLLYDPTHLFKNIRNNWITEKTKTLNFYSPLLETTVTASWSDLVSIYKEEEKAFIKRSKLNYSALYPNGFEKQKVSLVSYIFNEKTVAALKLAGKSETAAFIGDVNKMWNILNVKSPNSGTKLHDEDRYPFKREDDKRLTFLHKMATSFKIMDGGNHGARVKCLTSDTSNALHLTLNGFCKLIPSLLKYLCYVLPGKLQSDRLEGEFGIYRQQSGGNYHISVAEVYSSLQLQRLKLFSRLEIKEVEHNDKQLCCQRSLNDQELDSLDSCFDSATNLSVIERSALFYISGYVTFKEKIAASEFAESTADSEFLEMVSRGRLSHPSTDLFELAQYLYCYYKTVDDKHCRSIILKAFAEILKMCEFTFANEMSILKRFVNSFSKGLVTQQTDVIRKDKGKQKQVKQRRLDFS